MDGWIDRWMNGWMMMDDRWINGQMNRWTDGQIDEWIDGYMSSEAEADIQVYRQNSFQACIIHYGKKK